MKVVLTSHNPGFIYALDYYEKSMSISNVTNYYIANRIESNMQVTYKCINDNTEELYQLLSNPTIIIDNKYIKEIEGKNE